jgi:hypothetical protein
MNEKKVINYSRFLQIGFISCGSSSSSKPTTPVPITNSLVSSDKTSDESEGGVEEEENCSNHYRNHSHAECSINKLNKDDVSCEIITTTSDNESGKELTRNSKSSSNNYDLHSPPLSSSLSISKHGAKIRSKHRNSSLTDQSSSLASTTVRYRKKHISLDDEIVIYESDSSLVESRRRLSNSNRSHHRHLQLNSSRGGNSDNQVRASVAISRHKSEENPSFMQQPLNQIVSILKRGSTGSNGNQSPSLVTFSPNVKDVEASSSTTRLAHRQGGILKKRSSLDESSRRYRSHSPSSASSESEKGCMRKSCRRRNSCEEIHHHGILKQKSYESTGYSSSSGVNTPNSTSSGVQGILKKPSLTPSDHSNEQVTKHVSISEAVILAAAELCKDMVIDESYGHEPYIKPILKLDNDHHSLEIRPKPILKKNHSSENEEIRSILKSRKSSREEDS